ncbi:MAG: hypothetical protein KAS49_05590, partial [Candidatus Cloacimonetes bacterium]|nr:hypothetical protein [Candidatus Cloacimonadota bacterium]
MKKIIFILLSISALIGCTQKTNLVIGFEKKHGLNLPFDIAYEANFLSKNELSTKQFNSAKITLEKLNSDKIDLAILPFPLIWQANSNGANLQTISFFQREAGCLATRSDFLGKVGVIKNSLESIMLNELSKQDSLKYQVAYYQSIDKLVDDYDENMIDAICVKIPQLFLFKKLSDKIWLSDTFGSYPNYNIVTT